MKYAKTGFSVVLRDTKHMDFTDLPLLSPFIGKMLGSGERDKKELMTIAGSVLVIFLLLYVLAWFKDSIESMKMNQAFVELQKQVGDGGK